jgi:hypothetical protein
MNVELGRSFFLELLNIPDAAAFVAIILPAFGDASVHSTVRRHGESGFFVAGRSG